ncbi:MGH1-like glycoside hydrolase domain-containing protein [Saccharopolyspora griseoalba]|uniref:Mannosylglycerate hydrolase MGH1-like glycoside hydrolase domain-containing protein n=1 Tax=Saccharopolyspora griseoalba TaxID=1431848 RepID=A0ABW2LLT6_9PSEU
MNTRSEALRVLLGNWRGYNTVPAPDLYPHQWSWDSAFIAIGTRHLSPLRAQRELESLFGAQWDDGRVPHIVFDPATPDEGYFPGPSFWNSKSVTGPGVAATSGIVQPPVHALAAWEVFQSDPDTAQRRRFLQRLYPKLVAWHEYLRCRRDLGGAGLVSIVHPWESGMDNSPAWDPALARVRPVSMRRYRRRDLDHADASQRPTDEDYGRYVRLVETYRDSGYADRPEVHEFAVEDPLTNALLAASEEAMAGIADEVGAPAAPHLAELARLREAMVARLFSGGLFHPFDVRSGELTEVGSVAGLVPLVVPDLPVAEELIATATGPRFRAGELGVVPSFDLTDERFDPARYWRGPAWFNIGWLIRRGLLTHGASKLAEVLRSGYLEVAERAGFREYADPHRATGLGAHRFAWTAALTLDLIETR